MPARDAGARFVTSGRLHVVAASKPLLVLLVLGNVALQLVAALILKLAPPFSLSNALAVALILAAVLTLNIARFWLWGALHRRYPISVAYPASALLFPGVLAMAWYFGEPVAAAQISGAGLVLIGVALLLSEDSEAP